MHLPNCTHDPSGTFLHGPTAWSSRHQYPEQWTGSTHRRYITRHL